MLPLKAEKGLFTCMLSEWKKKIVYKPKQQTLVTFKRPNEAEPGERERFLDARTKLTGVFPLRIETGRFTQKLQEHLCTLCNIHRSILTKDEHYMLLSN